MSSAARGYTPAPGSLHPPAWKERSGKASPLARSRAQLSSQATHAENRQPGAKRGGVGMSRFLRELTSPSPFWNVWFPLEDAFFACANRKSLPSM